MRFTGVLPPSLPQRALWVVCVLWLLGLALLLYWHLGILAPATLQELAWVSAVVPSSTGWPGRVFPLSHTLVQALPFTALADSPLAGLRGVWAALTLVAWALLLGRVRRLPLWVLVAALAWQLSPLGMATVRFVGPALLVGLWALLLALLLDWGWWSTLGRFGHWPRDVWWKAWLRGLLLGLGAALLLYDALPTLPLLVVAVAGMLALACRALVRQQWFWLVGLGVGASFGGLGLLWALGLPTIGLGLPMAPGNWVVGLGLLLGIAPWWGLLFAGGGRGLASLLRWPASLWPFVALGRVLPLLGMTAALLLSCLVVFYGGKTGYAGAYWWLPGVPWLDVSLARWLGDTALPLQLPIWSWWMLPVIGWLVVGVLAAGLLWVWPVALRWRWTTGAVWAVGWLLLCHGVAQPVLWPAVPAKPLSGLCQLSSGAMAQDEAMATWLWAQGASHTASFPRAATPAQLSPQCDTLLVPQAVWYQPLWGALRRQYQVEHYWPARPLDASTRVMLSLMGLPSTTEAIRQQAWLIVQRKPNL